MTQTEAVDVDPQTRVVSQDWEQETLATVYIGDDQLEKHEKIKVALLKDEKGYMVEESDPDGWRFTTCPTIENASDEMYMAVDELAQREVECLDRLNLDDKSDIINVEKSNDRLRLNF